jgi:hypothetical protein
VWEVLSGRVQQRRVWTFGREEPPRDALAPPGCGGPTLAALLAGAAPAVSSREPLSIRSGVLFVSVSAGRAHGAAADAGGHVFTWGANEHGQCGAEPGARPAISHTLPPAPPPAPPQALAAAGAEAPGDAAGGTTPVAPGRRLGKIDSLDVLEASVRLPGSLLQALRAQRSLQRAVAAGSGGGSDAGAAAAPPPLQTAAHRQLHVYRLTIGQAVHMVSCGGVRPAAQTGGRACTAAGGLLPLPDAFTPEWLPRHASAPQPQTRRCPPPAPRPTRS